jgi:hypothetical protein
VAVVINLVLSRQTALYAALGEGFRPTYSLDAPLFSSYLRTVHGKAKREMDVGERG